jgi:hypothetical protein
MENLRDKAIKIKGKDYVQVSDRILAFNEMYNKADIITNYFYIEGLNMFVVRAEIITEKGTFTGMSQAVIGDGYINKTSALENAETSAVGRALGMMGIGVLDSVASIDEINKASYNDIKVNTIPKMISGLDKAKQVSIENKKKDIKIFLEINSTEKPKTKEDYEKACLEMLGIELVENNYDEIIKIINKQ